MKWATLFCLLALAGFGRGNASEGHRQDYPTSPGVSVGEDFNVEIQASYEWGVVPFDLLLTAVVTQGDDSILGVAWDFDSDGTVDAHGVETYHTFGEAIDYQISAEIETAHNGNLIRTTSVSGYYALMTLAFDDGHISDYTEALPLLDSKGVEGTAYIVPTWLGARWYMTWDYVQDLQDAGWDIGSHSMTHPALTVVNDSTLHWELAQSQIELQSRGFPAKHFAVPSADYDEHVIDAIRLYYESNHVEDGFNPPLEETDPYRLMTFTSQPWVHFDVYQSHIDSVKAAGGWYILLNHKIASNCYGTSWCIDTQMLSDVIDHALVNRINIVTVDEALSYISNPAAGISSRSAATGSILRIESVDNRLAFSGGNLKIRYGLTAAARLDAAVYDVRGRRVRSLAGGRVGAGVHTLIWYGDNELGDPVGSSTYFIAFRTGDGVIATRKISVIR